jgi:hypothetical protein
MKKLFLTLLVGLAVASCSHDDGLYNPVEPGENQNKDSKFDANAHAASIFGVDFDANQDWNSVTTGKVTVVADANLDNITKIQILTEVPACNDDARVLTEVAVQNGQSTEISFDAPSYYKRLYAACVNDKGVYYFKGFNVGEGSVSFSNSIASARGAMKAPEASSIKLGSSTPSFNNLRATTPRGTMKTKDLFEGSKWENEYLWSVDETSAAALKTPANGDIDAYEKIDLLNVFHTYLNRDKQRTRIEMIRNSDMFTREHNTLTATGEEPIVLTPMFFPSSEMKYCDIYYYYYNPTVMEGKSEAEQIQILKDLPKYKAFSCNEFKDCGKQEVSRGDSYVLPYFGDDAPKEGKAAVSLIIPENYKVGFMYRKMMNVVSKTNLSGKTQDVDYQAYGDYFYCGKIGKQNGEGYGDGRLNKQINHFGDFASAKLNDDDTRIAIFSCNGKSFLAVEDGVEQQYSDAFIEVVGGIEDATEAQTIKFNVFTFCFEDRIDENTDYDMNDVVIKAERLDATHVKYSLVACGAYDEIYLRNINGKHLNKNTEVHAMFGKPANYYINTTNSGKVDAIVDTIEVKADFSLADASKQMYIYDANTKEEIRLATKGEDPHAILIPYDFQYPTEKTCVKDAYLEFNSWGQNPIAATDWYTKPVAGKVF